MRLSQIEALVKFSRIVSAIVLSASIAHADVEDQAKKFLGRFDVDVAIAAPEFSIINGLDGDFGYGYKVSPAYQGGTFLRVDQWTLSTPIKFGDMFESFIAPLYFNLAPGTQITFIRPFKSHTEALLAVPEFDPRKVPFDAKHALAMPEGEAIIVPMRLNLAAGIGLTDATLPITPNLDGHYFINGLFQVQVLRLTKSLIRLRVVASREAGKQGGISIVPNLQLFKFSPINDGINAFLGENIGAINWASAKHNLFMADYIFDLSDKTAVGTYNSLFTTNNILKNVKLANPLGRTDKNYKLFISDLAAVDKIAKADSDIHNPRIRQIFKGRNIGTREGWDAKIGFSFANTGVSHYHSIDNHMIFMDSDNKKTDYLMPTDDRRSETHLFWGWIDEVSTRSTAVVAATGANGKPFDLGSYVLTREVKDKDLEEHQSMDLLREYRRLVPEQVRKTMNIEKYLNNKEYDDARVYFEIILNFNEVVNQAIGLMTDDQLQLAMKVYLADHDGDLPGAHLLNSDQLQSLKWVDAHNDEIFDMVHKLHYVFGRSSMTYQQRIEYFMKLQDNDAFRVVGTGFLTDLIGSKDLSDVIKVTTIVSAKNLKHSINSTYGHSPAAEVVHVSQYIQNLISNGGFDLRLETFGQGPNTSGEVLKMSDISKKYSNSSVPKFDNQTDN